MRPLSVCLVVATLLLIGPSSVTRAQSESRSSARPTSDEERLAIIETRLQALEKLGDRIDRLQDKVSDLSLQLQALNTKMSLMIWIGAGIGTIVIADLFRNLSRERATGGGGASRTAYLSRRFPTHLSKDDLTDAEARIIAEREIERLQSELDEERNRGPA